MGAVTLLTDEEFLNLPETDGKQELLDGELISLPVAKKVHTDICVAICELLRTGLDWKRILPTAGYRLRTGRWLIPDVSVVWPDQAYGDWYEGAPMIAIEVVSRGNRAEEIKQKTQMYLEDGAAEVWIIYPAIRTLDVFRKDGSYVSVAGVYDCALIGLQLNLAKILPAA